MTAENLKTLYETELQHEIEKLGSGSEEGRGLRRLLSASRRMHPGELCEQEHPRVWLWSDLHLGHAMALSVFGRPYWTPEEMDDDLFGAWQQVVHPRDTVVILGDVAIGGLSGRRLKRLRTAPGRRLLIVGNHEFDGTVGGDLDGFDEVFSAVYVPGSPELLLTHVPLRHVPEGCVNVHGHLHLRSPPGTRHINVAVEQVLYQPKPLTAVRRLGAALANGERVPGRTTAEQLTHIDPTGSAGTVTGSSEERGDG